MARTKKVEKEEVQEAETPVVGETTGTEEQSQVSEATGTDSILTSENEKVPSTFENEKVPSTFENKKIVSVGERKVSENGVVTYNCLCDDECRYDVPVISE